MLDRHYNYESQASYSVLHYDDVIMTTIASQITSLTSVYSTVYSDAHQRKHQSSASLAFVWGTHRDRWIPRTKGQLRGKCFHLMTSSWDGKSLSEPFMTRCEDAYIMMTSSNGNIFPVTGHLCGEIHRSTVNSPYKGQWCGALMFSLIYAWIKGWVNKREAGDLRHHRVHCDVIVMYALFGYIHGWRIIDKKASTRRTRIYTRSPIIFHGVIMNNGCETD